MNEQILNFLRQHPGSTSEAIGASTGIDKDMLSMLLGLLESQHEITVVKWGGTNSSGRMCHLYYAN